MKLNSYIDHTLLKPTATKNEIIKLCNEAITYDFFAVCVNGCYVALANELLSDSSVKVCSVIGFPLGAMATEAKVFEAKNAIAQGADEIDMVINLGALKNKHYDFVFDDINQVKKAIGDHTLKVILEISELSYDEISKASSICVDAKADFVKTSTGFSSGGASIEAINIMKKAINGKAKMKASGGIRDYDTAKTYIDLGVDRLGVSSGIAIMNGTKSNSNY
ncbi:MAG: deoxyribose-phosphate aldolase [Bacteroidia bacterium]|nr:deoxyribose-phosphate aldolase [Bacteroidia bacterium]NND26811.1 deoxyribose-phosphate aldolase [Flavobacteriaceae bacterium]MBT8278123.1 deoxyribose-phosphate aldolase [Bacteroidia bacterium]NNK61355.1 deoxyribose-phosphate aldolase [Flavobacteriaceae bacterium]NNL33715.1 deoxyribose-phosphate aldolase [Flavobacteriaceae bacterium]